MCARPRRDEFPPKTVKKVAERAAYICSSPECQRVTIGPDTANHVESIKTGRASHICSAAPGGPRYDESQTQNERSSITNAIWLCGACADLVDKNGGQSYPIEHLKKWKKDHETFMRSALEGRKRIVFHSEFNLPDSTIARRVLVLLESKGVLFVPLNYEFGPFVADSFSDIRSQLVSMRSMVHLDSPLDTILLSIIAACRHYMNTTSRDATQIEMGYSLGAARKAIGVNVENIAKLYNLEVKGNLFDILPQ